MFPDNVPDVFELLEFPDGASAERGKDLFQTAWVSGLSSTQRFSRGRFSSLAIRPQSLANRREAERPIPRMQTAGSTRGCVTLRNIIRGRRCRIFSSNTITEEVDGQQLTTDPAADITAYLLESSEPWQPITPPEVGELSDAIEALAFEYLTDSVSVSQAQEFLASGIPNRYATEVKVDELSIARR